MSQNRPPHPLTDPRPTPQEAEETRLERDIAAGRVHWIEYPRAAARPYVVLCLIAVNLLLFLPFLLAPDFFWQLMGALVLYPYGVLHNGEVLRLFSSMFMHWSVGHVMVNMLSLYSLGRGMERLFGWQRFLLIYLLGGLGGSVLYLLFDDGGVAAGASGAIFALFGVEMVYTYLHRNTFYGDGMRRRLQELGFLLVLNLGMNIASPMIALWAHVGGLVGGMVLAWFLAPRWSFGESTKTNAQGIPVRPAIDQNPLQRRHFGVVFVYGLGLLGVYLLALFLTHPQPLNLMF